MKLEITEEQFAELAKEHGYIKIEPSSTGLAVKPKFGRVKPKEGEAYYSLFAGLELSKRVWGGNDFDEELWITGNVYLTLEAAELARDRQQAKVRVIDKLAELRADELDWENTQACKYYLLVDGDSVNYDYVARYQALEKGLYSTEKACEWVVENMADDVITMLTGE